MSGKKKPVKIAIIGAGLIGHRHIQHVVDEPRCELTDVLTRTTTHKNLVERAGARHFTDLNEFLKHTTSEAVIVATPNDTHAPIGIKCAEKGLHLLVEKPIDADLKAAAKLVETADKAGVKVLIGHHRRHNPYVLKAKRIIDSGKLGQIVGVNALWTLLKPLPYFDVTKLRSRQRSRGSDAEGEDCISLTCCKEILLHNFSISSPR